MQRIEIIALKKDGKKIINRLQRRGSVEICDVSDDALAKRSAASAISELEKKRTDAQNAIEILQRYSEKKPSLLDSLEGKRELGEKEFKEKSKSFGQIEEKIKIVLDTEREISELKSGISGLALLCESLETWKKLDIPTAGVETKFTVSFVGSVPLKFEDGLFSDISEKADVHVINRQKTSTDICVICLKSDADEVFSVLRDMGFSEISDKADKTPAQLSEKYRAEAEQKQSTVETKEKSLTELSKGLKDAELYYDGLSMEEDRLCALQKSAESKETVIISGYIPEKYGRRISEELEKSFSAAVRIYEADEEDDVPVLLENDRFSRPVEGITEMYSLPGKDDLDPTPIMSFFYYLFFGMMLSDAGYGLVMVIVTTVALKKFNLGAKMRETMRMFRYCGISTVFWGALFGSWYGDLPQVIARDFFGKDIGSTALWFEPINKPMKLLLFSFGLGIIHLFVGLSANFYKEWKAGKRLDAVCDVIPVMLTVLGAAPLAAGILTSVPEGLSKIGGYVAIVGVVLVVLTSSRSSKNIFMRFFGGIYGLYNVATGYLSDILSYSRLLALGLATGCIAQVINLIGAMPSNAVAEGILLFILFLTAHTANIAINLLGAYVHTDRLQFVELFSKFYEGGGRAFEPLKQNTKYITLKEETSNE